MTPGIEDIRKFYDSWVDYLAIERGRHRAVYKLLDAYIPKTPCSVLDIGCGTGHTSRHLASGGRSVVAVDLSPVLIEYAKNHNDGAGIEYLAADIATWQDPRKFDYIVMVDVLEHILPSAVDSLMSVLRRASHNHTLAFVHLPHPRWMDAVARQSKTTQPVETRWTMGAVESAFAGAGFMPVLFHMSSGDYYESVLTREERLDEIYGAWIGGTADV